MKTITKTIAVFCVLAVTAFAQSSDTPTLQYFRGGNLNLNVSTQLNGFGAGSGSFGGVLGSNFGSGAQLMFGNPASLAHSSKAQFYVDYAPGANLGSLIKSELEKNIKSSTDDFLEDTVTVIFPVSSYKSYSKVGELNVGRNASISSFAFSIPVYKNTVFGVGMYYPTEFEMDVQAVGIQMLMQSVKDVSGNSVTIDIPLHADVGVATRFSMSALTISAASELFNDARGYLRVGLAANRYEVNQYINLDINFNGFVMLNKNQEYHYNDPNDSNIDPAKGESNNFYWKAKADFSMAKWGFKVGAEYHTPALPDVNFNFLIDIVPNFEMTDPNAKSESYQPNFITGKVFGDKDQTLDIKIDSLKLQKPNLTTPTYNDFSNKAVMHYPSSISFGADVKLGEHYLALGLVKYIGEFSYQFGKIKFGKDAATGIKFGTSLAMPEDWGTWGLVAIPLRILFLDIDGLIFQLTSEYTGWKNPKYRIEGGVILGTGIAQGLDDDNNKSLKDVLDMPFPSGFALSREYTLRENIKISALILGFPDIGAKLGIGVGL